MERLEGAFSEKMSGLSGHTRLERLGSDAVSGVLSQDERAFFANRDRRQIGQWAENLSERFLLWRGLKILNRNVRERFSELDIVARDGGELVFVEVRCRRKNKIMTAAETIGRQKWRRLTRGAELYTLRVNWTGSWRIDLISIDVSFDRWRLNWLKYLEMPEMEEGY